MKRLPGKPESWENVTMIRAAGEILLGLRSDGTVVLALPNGRREEEREGNNALAQWKDITAIATNGTSVVGTTKDGRLMIMTLGKEQL